MSPTIELLSPALLPALSAHLARHRAESGTNGDIHFMPFEPGDGRGPRPPEATSLTRPLDQPG